MASKKIDVEEDVALVDVDNAAAASLFSPNMWVRKPSRQPGMYSFENRTSRSPPDTTHPSPLKDCSNLQHQKQRQLKRQAPSLDLLDAIDKEGTEKEQTDQDFSHIALLEESINHAQAVSRRLETRIREARETIAATIKENTGMKRLFSALQVQREDFNLEGIYGEQPRKKRMIDIGNRLMDNLNGVVSVPPHVDATEDAPVKIMSTSQPHRQSQQQQTPAPPVPGQMAHKPAVTPAAHYPAESQIAAAALTLAQGEPAAALLSLLEKALAARTHVHGSTAGGHQSGGGNGNGVTAGPVHQHYPGRYLTEAMPHA